MPFPLRLQHTRPLHARPLHARRRQPRLVGAAVAAVAAAGLLGLTATAASAHVSVRPDVTASGSEAELVFRVPNETPSATTTKVVLTLPQTNPFTEVSVEPVPGWDITVTDAPLPTPTTVDRTTITKAPHVVTWTATGASAITPGEYQSFAISAGPLPAPGMLELPVDQISSDGSVVRWVDPTTEGTPEPEHPAPHFEVTTAAGAGLSDDTNGVNDATARWLSVAALVVALGAVAVQFVGRRRRSQ